MVLFDYLLYVFSLLSIGNFFFLGYYSFRHPEEGTWFIQSLCTEINKHDLSAIDLLRIMTRVSRRVALDHESYNPENLWIHQRKQIPTIHSMLIRDVFFKPKKKSPPVPKVVNTDTGMYYELIFYFILTYEMQNTILYFLKA